MALGVPEMRQEVMFSCWVLCITVELVIPKHSYDLQLSAVYHCRVGSPQYKVEVR